MTHALLHAQIPVIGSDEIDWEQLTDDWCSGELWRERTGDTSFEVATYYGREEMLKSAAGRPREGGPLITLGTFVHLARLGGYKGIVTDEMELFDEVTHTQADGCDADGHFGKLANDDRPISASELASGHYPAPTFLIDGLILKDEVNLLYGDGGTGKTTLALQFAVGIASGQPVLGHKTTQMPVLLVLAEDGAGETKRRLEAICSQMHLELGRLPLQVWPRPGDSCVLADVADTGEARDGVFMAKLRTVMAEIGPCFVVLDALADFANLDEIKRQPVNTLFKRVLGSLCRQFGATLLMLGHPSKSAMSDGSQYSGSTAFNNAVRQRLTITTERDAPFDGKRVLRVAKANYAPLKEMDVFLVDGFFTTAQQVKASERHQIERNRVFDVTRDLLERGEQVVDANGNGLKPKDIAAILSEKHQVKLSPKQVREHLQGLRREARLGYQNADNSKRGVRAGYTLLTAA